MFLDSFPLVKCLQCQTTRPHLPAFKIPGSAPVAIMLVQYSESQINGGGPGLEMNHQLGIPCVYSMCILSFDL